MFQMYGSSVLGQKNHFMAQQNWLKIALWIRDATNVLPEVKQICWRKLELLMNQNHCRLINWSFKLCRTVIVIHTVVEASIRAEKNVFDQSLNIRYGYVCLSLALIAVPLFAYLALWQRFGKIEFPIIIHENVFYWIEIV